MHRFAQLIREDIDHLAILETLDVGKPILNSVNVDVTFAADCIAYYAEFADKLYDEVAPTAPHELALVRREPFWAAHRSHFYQRATDNGFTVWRVVSEVFVLNLALAALAIASTKTQSAAIEAVLVVIGAAAVAFSMYRFSQRRLL